MSVFLLWFLITVLPSLGAALLFISIGAFICAGAVAFHLSMDCPGDDEGKKRGQFAKTCLVVSAVFMLLAVPVPSRSDIMLIVGGYAATNNQELAKLPDNILKAANVYLGEIINTKK